MINSHSNVINTSPSSRCYLCGSQGVLLHQDLTDFLFGITGKWNLKRCIDPKCGLVWIDPMPIENDIYKLYRNYYTHPEQEEHEEQEGDLFRHNSIYSIFRRTRALLLKLTTVQKEQRAMARMFLSGQCSGKLLEVGCGDGKRLAQMREMGWQVQGQEIDGRAATRARNIYGLQVHLGPLSNIGFPEDNFDAVIMHHVIEHLSDPISILQECLRVLKPDGQLLAVTPNIDSLGHKWFGSSWRGLEPPRHLFLFSPRTLQIAARRAGFSQVNVWTSAVNAKVFAEESLKIRFHYRHNKKGLLTLIDSFTAACLQICEIGMLLFYPMCGDESVLIAKY